MSRKPKRHNQRHNQRHYYKNIYNTHYVRILYKKEEIKRSASFTRCACGRVLITHRRVFFGYAALRFGFVPAVCSAIHRTRHLSFTQTERFSSLALKQKMPGIASPDTSHISNSTASQIIPYLWLFSYTRRPIFPHICGVFSRVHRVSAWLSNPDRHLSVYSSIFSVYSFVLLLPLSASSSDLFFPSMFP